MSYTPNKTLLERLRAVQKSMSSLQEHLADKTDSEATQHVGKYFTDAQAYLKDTLDRFEEESDEATLNTFNQIEPAKDPEQELKEHMPPPESPKELIAWTLARQKALADWCETMSTKAISGKTTSLFGEIAEHLNEQGRQFASDTKPYAQDYLHP